MHSRIFELSTRPIPEDERYDEDSLPEWFEYSQTDWWRNTDDRESDIEWLVGSLRGVAECDGDGRLVFKEDAAKTYFAPLYPLYQQCLTKLQSVTPERFATNDQKFNMDMYQLKVLFEDEFGFYIYCDNELVPINRWLREWDLTVPYYIGGIIDYHY